MKFKWPKPIEVVHRFDSRSRLFQDTPEEETSTAGGEPIIVKPEEEQNRENQNRSAAGFPQRQCRTTP